MSYKLNTAMRLPKALDEGLCDLLEKSNAVRAAYQRLEAHTECFTEEMQRAIDANDHEFKPLIDHEIKGQEMVDELEKARQWLVISGQTLADRWGHMIEARDNQHTSSQ